MNSKVTLFEVLNAPAAADPTVVAIAAFLAERLIWLVPIVLAGCWLWGDRLHKRSVTAATFAGLLALLIAQACSLYYTPRPFAAGVGHTLLAHAADSSFPSDHATLMAAVALSLASIRATRLQGMALAAFWFPMAWARVYLGVHFPIDMLGGLAIGTLAMLCVQWWGAPFVDFAFPRVLWLYLIVFRWFIRKGWLR